VTTGYGGNVNFPGVVGSGMENQWPVISERGSVITNSEHFVGVRLGRVSRGARSLRFARRTNASAPTRKH
jgi:hypothetical protein